MQITRYTTTALALPAPRTAINIRVATMDDLPFMDALQKKHNRQLGYFPTRQFEGYIQMGAVLVAESVETKETRNETKETRDETPESGVLVSRLSSLSTPLVSRLSSLSTPLGYIIWRDRYLKRDELGVIFQLCVEPGAQRKLVGAALVREAFERSAYGCRLFCCWCAQDIDANHFWEGLGFVPIAFRAGSAVKGKGRTSRVHIFWQKRIREGDDQTPYWFPSQTSSGAIRADRLVFPIPPGTHWKEVEAVAVPTEAEVRDQKSEVSEQRVVALAACPPVSGAGVASTGRQAASGTAAPKPKKAAPGQGAPKVSRGPVVLCGFRFASQEPPAPAAPTAPAKPKKPKAPAAKIKPEFLKAARELRDRFLEAVQRDPQALLPSGKYDVARALPEAPDQRHAVPRLTQVEVKALPEAA